MATTFFPPASVSASASIFAESTPHTFAAPRGAARSNKFLSNTSASPLAPADLPSAPHRARTRRNTSASRNPDVPLRGSSHSLDERTRSVSREFTTTTAGPFLAARRVPPPLPDPRPQPQTGGQPGRTSPRGRPGRGSPKEAAPLPAMPPPTGP